MYVAFCVQLYENKVRARVSTTVIVLSIDSGERMWTDSISLFICLAQLMITTFLTNRHKPVSIGQIHNVFQKTVKLSS